MTEAHGGNEGTQRRNMKRRLLLGHLEVGLTRESRTGRLYPLAFQVAREVVLQPVFFLVGFFRLSL